MAVTTTVSTVNVTAPIALVTDFNPAFAPLNGPMAALSGGRAIVAYTAGATTGNLADRVMGADGQPLTPWPYLDPVQAHFYRNPMVAGLANGGAVAIFGEAAGGLQFYWAQLINADGSLSGQPISIGGFSSQFGWPADAAILGIVDDNYQQRFVSFLWTDGETTTAGYIIRIFNSSGGVTHTLSSNPGGGGPVPDVYLNSPLMAALTDPQSIFTAQRFVLTYHDVAGNHFRAYDNELMQLNVGSPTVGFGDRPIADLVGLTNTEFAFVQTHAGASGLDIYLFSYDITGALLFSRLVADAPADLTNPQLVALGAEYLIVGWRDPGVGADAYRIYDWDGNLVVDTQALPAGATLHDIVAIGYGRFALAWTDSAAPATLREQILDIRISYHGDGADDVITGSTQSDVINGGGGDDLIVGTPGNDFIDGGAGVDTASFVDNMLHHGFNDPIGSYTRVVAHLDTATQTVTDSYSGAAHTLANVENIVAGPGSDALYGDANNNWLNGGAGSDSLYGGGGDDRLFGDGSLFSIVDGGAGSDTVDLSSLNVAVAIHLDTSTPYARYATLVSIENATGGSGDDYIYGNAEANILNGNGGNDAIYGGDGNDIINTGDGSNYVEAGYGADIVTGGAGADLIYGIAGDDVLNGGDGDDQLFGAFGSYTLIGGNGVDVLQVGAHYSAVSVSGGAGEDYLIVATVSGGVWGAADIENWFGASGADAFFASGSTAPVYMRGADGSDDLRGGSGSDYLYGDGAWDQLFGGDGNDVLSGGAGADELRGGVGDDLLYVDAADATVFGFVVDGGAGTDYVVVQDTNGVTLNLAAASVEWAQGYSGNDVLYATGASVLVEIHGGDGADVLVGGAATSILLGEAGADRLVGENGVDHFVGGAGADTIVEAANGGVDWFYDYEDGVDRIDMSGSGAANFAALSVDNTYAASNWYGVTYGVSTLWVSTGGIGVLDASDFIF